MDNPDILPRMHTAEHIFFRALQQILTEKKQEIVLDKIDLGKSESSCFVLTPILTWHDLFAAEKKVNDIIQENLPISETFIKRAALEAYKKTVPLRIKEDRITDDIIRIIEIQGFDWSACNKQHCAITQDIGSFLVTRFNRLSANTFEVKFTVDPLGALYTLSRPARELVSACNTPPERLVSVINNLRQETEALKHQISELSKQIHVELIHEPIPAGELVTGTFVGLPQKHFVEKILAAKKENVVLCGINKTDNVSIVLVVADGLPFNANEILQKLFKRYPGKGGGRKELAQGTIGCTSEKEIFMALKDILNHGN